jgi:hypothetical protein
MFLIKLLFRLWLIGVQMGLWGTRTELGMQQSHHCHSTAAAAAANSAAAAPTVGIAARQGRRFSMEDRAVQESTVLGPGRGCGPVNYTYTAGGCSWLCCRTGPWSCCWTESINSCVDYPSLPTVIQGRLQRAAELPLNSSVHDSS